MNTLASDNDDIATWQVFVVVGVILLGLFGLIGGITLGALAARHQIEQEKPAYCYFVTDNNGREHSSKTMPYYGDVGVYWDRPDAWGYVLSPAAVRVDKDCLRAKGVEVPK